MSQAPTPFGRYQLAGRLAIGGMAEVFLAKSVGPGGFVKSLVIKRILPHLCEDPAFVEMFLREAQVAAKLDHPNVVQIFDFGEVEGTYYLAMEYVDGPNLRSILRRNPDSRLPEAISARIVSLACEGLGYAHDFCDPSTGEPLNLVHRDVSTDNIVVSRTGSVKVLDFGVAKSGGNSTRSNLLKGKVAYMPPEQIRGNADRRTDVYALGVILYELASGMKPYSQMPEVELLATILRQGPVPLRDRNPNVHPTYAEIVEKAMARRPDERYQTCHELQFALDDFVSGLGDRVGAQQLAQLVAAYRTSLAAASSDQKKFFASSPSSVARAAGSGAPSSPVAGSRPASDVKFSGLETKTPSQGLPRPTPGGTPVSSLKLPLTRSSTRTDPSLQAAIFFGAENHEVNEQSASEPVYLGDLDGEPTVESAQPATVKSGNDGLRETLVAVDSRAETLLLRAELVRNSRVMGRIGSDAELRTLRDSLTGDLSLELPSRFLRLAPRMMQVAYGAADSVQSLIRGAVESLVFIGDVQRVFDEFQRLKTEAAPEAPNARWVYEQARQVLLASGVLNRLEQTPVGPALAQLRSLVGAPESGVHRDDSLESRILSLAHVAVLFDVEAPFLATPFQELADRVAGLRDHWIPSGHEFKAWLAARGLESIRFSIPIVPEALRRGVRWLAEGSRARVPPTPGLEVKLKGGAAAEAWVESQTQDTDPVLSSIRRYIDLVAHFSAYGSQYREQTGGPFPDLGPTIRHLSLAAASGNARFMGVTSVSIGKEGLSLHAANVVMLVLSFGARLGMTPHELEQLGWLAALHDLGLFKVPEQVFRRSRHLLLDRANAVGARPFSRLQRLYLPPESGDRETWYRATLSSAAVPLLKSFGPLGVRAATLALEWMQPNRGATAELIAVAKNWDVLTSRRPDGPPKTPEAAGLDLLAGRYTKAHPFLVSTFVRFAHKQTHHSLPAPTT